jgi:hypothetical protein
MIDWLMTDIVVPRLLLVFLGAACFGATLYVVGDLWPRTK